MATWVTRVRACGTRGGRGRGRVATNMGCAHARRKCDTGRGPRVTVAPSVPTPPWPTTMQRRSTGVGAWVGASVGYVRQRVPTVSDGEEDGRRGVAQQREGQSVNVRRQAVRSSNGGAQAAGSQPCGCSQRLRDVRAKAIRDPGWGWGWCMGDRKSRVSLPHRTRQGTQAPAPNPRLHARCDGAAALNVRWRCGVGVECGI